MDDQETGSERHSKRQRIYSLLSQVSEKARVIKNHSASLNKKLLCLPTPEGTTSEKLSKPEHPAMLEKIIISLEGTSSVQDQSIVELTESLKELE